MKTTNRRRAQAVPDRLGIRQNQVCLPDKVIDDVPACAYSCILQFVLKNYHDSTCAATSNLDLLCVTQTVSGQTLGEASLQCVASYCSNEVNNTVLLSAYRVCEDVDNAVPNTASVINATIRPATPQAPTVQNAVPTIQSAAPTAATNPPAQATPAATGIEAGGRSTSMVISGDGMSVTMEVMMMATPSAPTATPTMTSNGSNFVPEQTGNSQGLSMAQVAGIAAGTGVAAVIIIAVIFIFCRRRKRAKQTEPASVKEDAIADVPDRRSRPAMSTSPNTVISPNKRRSFWRMSIKPEAIGVAVTDKAKARGSFSSEKGMLKYMPTGNPFASPKDRLSWPEFGKEIGPGVRRDSISTIFDDDLEQQPTQAGVATRARATTITWSDRPKNTPQPLQLKSGHTPSASVDSGDTGTKSNALSLTPTYDNGQFAPFNSEPPVQYSIAGALAASAATAQPDQSSRMSFEPSGSATSPKRNKLQKKSTNPFKALMSPRGPPRRDVLTPTYNISAPFINAQESNGQSLYQGEPSPLAPRPLQLNSSRPFSPTSFMPVPKGIRPSRRSSVALPSGAMIGNTTDSTSSDGLASQYSLDFPVPPSRATLRDGAPSGLGLGTSRGSIPVPPLIPPSPLMKGRRGETMYESVYSTDSAATGFGDQQLSPNSRAKVTPTMKNSVGDLFFKVEMR
jgi:hypothetical protein